MILNVTPVPKPRMVKSDAWRKRPCVERYWQFKDKLLEEAGRVGYVQLDTLENITFVVPMAKSWSQKKRDKFMGGPHQLKPDLDNYVKAFMDCLCEEDQHIHTINNVKKVWGRVGCIKIGMVEKHDSDRNEVEILVREIKEE